MTKTFNCKQCTKITKKTAPSDRRVYCSKPCMYEALGSAYFQRIGRLGGKASNTGGFAGDPQRASQTSLQGWEKRRQRTNKASKSSSSGASSVSK